MRRHMANMAKGRAIGRNAGARKTVRMLGLALGAVLVAALAAPAPAVGEVGPPTIDCGADAGSQACRIDAIADPACTRSPCPAVEGTIVVRNQGASGVGQAGIGYALGGLEAAPGGLAPHSACETSAGFDADVAQEITCEFEQVGNYIKVSGWASGAVGPGPFDWKWGKITVYVYDPTTGFGFTGCEDSGFPGTVCSATLTGIPAHAGAKLVCGAFGWYALSVECEAY